MLPRATPLTKYFAYKVRSISARSVLSTGGRLISSTVRGVFSGLRAGIQHYAETVSSETTTRDVY
jgi:hypothetical protein